MMHEGITRGIKHWDLSGYSIFLLRITFCVNGQESSPQSTTFHTDNHYILWNDYSTQKRKLKK